MINSNFRIQTIKVKNYKNFSNLEINIEKFNVLVGSNATGKSNFVSIFSFLKTVVQDGLDNAITLHGGSEFLSNISSKKKIVEFEIHFISDTPCQLNGIFPGESIQNKLTTDNVIYKFVFDLQNKYSYKILFDKLIFNCKSFVYGLEDKKNESLGMLTILKKGNTISYLDDFPNTKGSIIQSKQIDLFKHSSLSNKQLLLESKDIGYLLRPLGEFFQQMNIYDFNPLQLKSTSRIREKVNLESDGSNLSIVLNHITRDKQKKQLFFSLMKRLLPFIKSIKIKSVSDGSVSFNLTEKYNKKDIPSIFISDGTVNIIALLASLFLQDNHFTIIEEPERNIHPAIITKIVNLMKEASITNQILITTHNPTFMDLVEIEDILLLSRDEKGVSTITKTMDNKIINKFKKSLTTGQMFAQGIVK